MRILTVDTFSLGSRAFYTSDISFFSMVSKVQNVIKPNHTVFAFDHPKLIRRDLYPDYKATRKPKDEGSAKAKAARLAFLRNLWLALKRADYNCLCLEGYEADDVIASIVKQINAEHYVLTGDKDLLQLCDVAKVCYVPKSFSDWQVCGALECHAITGYKPHELVLQKALAGERSDNIPGIPQIGPKRAESLIKAGYDTFYKLHGLDVVQANLVEFELSYELGRLYDDAPVAFIKREGDIDWALQGYLRLR